jgi:hypothetical protein
MHTIQLTNEQLRIVMSALAELPWRVANPIMAEIDGQLKQVEA